MCVCVCVTPEAKTTKNRGTIDHFCEAPCLPPLVDGTVGPTVCVCVCVYLTGSYQAGWTSCAGLSSEGNAQEGMGCWQRAKNTKEKASRAAAPAARAPEGLGTQ